MTALIIIAAIVLLLLAALEMPVTAYIRYYGGKLDVKAKYGFIRVYPQKEKSSVPKADKGTEKDREGDGSNESPHDEPHSDTNTESRPNKQKKPSLEERVNTLLDDLNEKKNAVQLAAELLEKPLKRLGRKVRISDLIIDFAAADEDACNAALSYGKLGAAVYNALAFAKCYARIGVKSVTVDCLYNTPSDKSRYDGEFKIRLRPISLLNALLSAFFRYIKSSERYSPIFETFKQ